jgi:phosphohistidine phosphatase
MRHAKSSWDDPGLDDHERPLNRRGRLSAQAMGDWLRRHDHLPEACICSTALRTRETFSGLALDCPVAFEPALYHATPHDLLEVLRGAKAHRILLIGHNPGIAEFAARLLRRPPGHPRFEDYPTCATLVADFAIDSWPSVTWSTGRVRDFAIPRELT